MLQSLVPSDAAAANVGTGRCELVGGRVLMKVVVPPRSVAYTALDNDAPRYEHISFVLILSPIYALVQLRSHVVLFS